MLASLLDDPAGVRGKEPEQPTVPPHVQPSASVNCMKDAAGQLDESSMFYVFLMEYKREFLKLLI